MFQINSATFLGHEKPESFLGTITEDNFFLVLEIENISVSQGLDILRIIKKDIQETDINNIASLESFFTTEAKKTNSPSEFSLAAGYFKDDILYLQTLSEGEIFLCRGNQFAKIISGENSASGYVQKEDLYAFSTFGFTLALDGEKGLKKLIEKTPPAKIVSDIKLRFQDFDNRGLAAVFIQIESSYIVPKQVNTYQPIPQVNFFHSISNIYQNLKFQSEKTGKKKTLTLIAVVTLFFILIWSVVLGQKRMQESQARKKITIARELVTQKLNQAEEVAFLNLSRSLTLVAEAREELKKIKKDLGEKKPKEIKELEDLVATTENKIAKKEEKKYEEFFDLALDNKNAKGSKLYLDNDNLLILDNQDNSIYKLSLTKKSLDKNKFPEIKSTSLVASYLDDVFFFTEKTGVYKISQDKKIKKVINNDNDWKDVTDIYIYNGNIYLLDRGKNDVFKYLTGGDDNYSAKKSYFGTGETIDLKNANSMAIDSAVYIGFPDYIKKFVSGVRDEFKTSYPNENINLVKIFTDKAQDRVYGWDKKAGLIYSLEKNGNFEKQINTQILKMGSDIVVFDKAIYVLYGSKIFKININ